MPRGPWEGCRRSLREGRGHLLLLPDSTFCTDEQTTVSVGKTPYARFDLNDYSVPHTHVSRTLDLRATPERVRILDGVEVIADHLRTYDKGQQVEGPVHIRALVEHKAAAREHRGLDRLHRAALASRDVCVAAAERGRNIGGLTNGLPRLLERYGAAELDIALREALDRGVPHQNTVRLILESARLRGDLELVRALTALLVECDAELRVWRQKVLALSGRRLRRWTSATATD